MAKAGQGGGRARAGRRVRDVARVRIASCTCGQLVATCTGEAVPLDATAGERYGHVAVDPDRDAAPVLPQETTQVEGSLQLVTVQPEAGQLTTHPPGGHATSQLPDV